MSGFETFASISYRFTFVFCQVQKDSPNPTGFPKFFNQNLKPPFAFMFSPPFTHPQLIRMIDGLDKKYQLILFIRNYEPIIR